VNEGRAPPPPPGESMSEPADEDAALMLAAGRGDEAAFASLVRRWQNRIVSLAYRYLGSAADAEDVAQEVFLRVHRARESYERNARFSTWIYRITVNASLNHLRGRKARKAVWAEYKPAGDDGTGGVAEPSDEGEPDPSASVDKDELARVLRAILDELPERQRAALLLNKYEGLGYEETAAAMDLSVPAVKSLLTRARVAVREKLEPYLTTGAWPRERET
jgi:RNA polymerase sigma-70 factor (ECF subfamily)